MKIKWLENWDKYCNLKLKNFLVVEMGFWRCKKGYVVN